MRRENYRFLLFLRKNQRPVLSNTRTVISRSGTNFIEIDGKFPTLDDGLLFMTGLGEFNEIYIFKSGESIPLNTLADTIKSMKDGFNSMVEEKYWLAHEIFEGLWKHFEGDLSKFFHGIVMLCVAMVHFQMNHESNAIRIFNGAKNELNPFLGDVTAKWSFSYPLDNKIVAQIKERSLSIVGN